MTYQLLPQNLPPSSQHQLSSRDLNLILRKHDRVRQQSLESYLQGGSGNEASDRSAGGKQLPTDGVKYQAKSMWWLGCDQDSSIINVIITEDSFQGSQASRDIRLTFLSLVFLALLWPLPCQDSLHWHDHWVLVVAGKPFTGHWTPAIHTFRYPHS